MGIYDKFKNLFQIKLKFNSKPFKSFIILCFLADPLMFC